MSKKIAILPGDGIGPEIIAEAKKVLECLQREFGLDAEITAAPFGGAGYDAAGKPLPDATLDLCKTADAILLGAVGGPQYDGLARAVRPERGLLELRSALGLYANLRPARLYPQLAAASSLKAERVSDLDIMFVRELTGGIYFGQPRGIETLANGERRGFNTMAYTETEIERIGHTAFAVARQRGKCLCSVDKMNVLEVSELWREIMESLAAQYPDVQLSHLYVDNAAMQLVRAPKQFDVIVTANMFGDILSDAAAMLTGSIGMLPSASLNRAGQGMYEPIHGSAPDIAGQGIANPLGTILSVAMLLQYSLDESALASHLEQAVGTVLDTGLRSADLGGGKNSAGTQAIGDAVVAALQGIAASNSA